MATRAFRRRLASERGSKRDRLSLALNSYAHLASVRARNSRAQSTVPGIIDASHGGAINRQPHPEVAAALAFAASGRNFAGFLAHRAAEAGVSLPEYLAGHSFSDFFVDLGEAYRYLYERARRNQPALAFSQFVETLARREVPLARYPDETLGSFEARAIFRQYFIGRGIPAHDSMVIVGGNGFKSLFGAGVAAVLTRERGERRLSIGGSIVAPRGHYHSLVAFPPLVGGRLTTLDSFDARSIAAALAKPRSDIRAVVLFAVDNPTGSVLDETELTAIADVIITHNLRHPSRPVYVIADDLYAGSILDPDCNMPRAAAAMTAHGRSLHDYTLTIGSTSKTFAFASARVGFATSGCPELIVAAGEWLRQNGGYHVAPPIETAALAAVALTPRRFVDANNATYRRSFAHAEQAVTAIRRNTGVDISMVKPQGGWYALLNVARSSLSETARSHIVIDDDLHGFLLYYGKQAGQAGCARDTGLVTFPASINGLEHGVENDPDTLTLRLSLALSERDLGQALSRLEQALRFLQRVEGPHLLEILQCAARAASHTQYEIATGRPLRPVNDNG